MVFMRKLLWLLLPLVLVVNIGAKLYGKGEYIGFSPIIELVKQFPTPEKTLESIQDFKESLEVFKVSFNLSKMPFNVNCSLRFLLLL